MAAMGIRDWQVHEAADAELAALRAKLDAELRAREEAKLKRMEAERPQMNPRQETRAKELARLNAIFKQDEDAGNAIGAMKLLRQNPPNSTTGGSKDLAAVEGLRKLAPVNLAATNLAATDQTLDLSDEHIRLLRASTAGGRSPALRDVESLRSEALEARRRSVEASRNSFGEDFEEYRKTPSSNILCCTTAGALSVLVLLLMVFTRRPIKEEVEVFKAGVLQIDLKAEVLGEVFLVEHAIQSELVELGFFGLPPPAMPPHSPFPPGLAPFPPRPPTPPPWPPPLRRMAPRWAVRRVAVRRVAVRQSLACGGRS